MAYDYQLVICGKGEGVLKITLNQPETLNALTPDLERELHAALQEGDSDPEVFCMVICGEGRAFCSGYAMGKVPGRKGSLTDPAIYGSIGEFLGVVQVHDYENVQHRQLDLWRLKKPVIAAVHGYCMGGGLWLAMACDMCYCAEDAVFGQPEVRHNANSTFLIPALTGWHRAARYLYTGDHFDGKEAERIGIVNECLPRGQTYAYRDGPGQADCYGSAAFGADHETPGPLRFHGLRHRGGYGSMRALFDLGALFPWPGAPGHVRCAEGKRDEGIP